MDDLNNPGEPDRSRTSQQDHEVNDDSEYIRKQLHKIRAYPSGELEQRVDGIWSVYEYLKQHRRLDGTREAFHDFVDAFMIYMNKHSSDF